MTSQAMDILVSQFFRPPHPGTARQPVAEAVLPQETRPVRFGEHVLTREPLALTDLDGTRIALQRQPLVCLDLLVRRAGRSVSREEIRDAIWGEDRFVDHDQGINFMIYRIRVALGDDARDPRFIETLPQVGYRWVASVEPLAPKPRWRSWVGRVGERWFGRSG